MRRERYRRRRPPRDRRFHALAFLLSMLLVAGIGALVYVITAKPSIVAHCSLEDETPRLLGRVSFVYAADGTRLGAIPTTRRRQPVALSQMSPWLPAATIAVEDARFFEHGGVDPAAIARSVVENARAGRVVQGGSTITQQIVRDRYLSGDTTLSRKLTEACLALELERRWSKERILQGYLNYSYYGHRAYGVEAAAQTYFSRSANRLTRSQAAVLAGLPQAPSRFDPFRNPKAARARRDDVLAAMREQGFISAARYRAAVRRPLRLHPGRLYRTVREPGFTEYVRRRLVDRYGERAKHGGLRVRTTLDLRLQRYARRAIRRWLHAPSDPAGALVAIDPRTGAIRAMTTVGAKRSARQFNVAAQSRRQAGSAFKVFTLAAALQHGFRLRTVWNGPPRRTIYQRRCRTGDAPWVVHNYADEEAGRMSLLRATAHSVNTIYAQLVARLGPRHVVDVAHRMGIRSPLKPVCAITLGSEGVAPLEMAAAFSTLAAGGVRHRAGAIARVTAPGDGVIFRLRDRRGRRVLSRSVVDRVHLALRAVVRSGTGRAAAIPGRGVVGKTGTAENYKDAWFCGYLRRLAACAWVGHPGAEIPLRNVAGFPQVFGGSIPARIWRGFMVRALRAR